MAKYSEEQLLSFGYRKYTGESIDVFFNTDLCEHSGNCVRGNSNVFDTQKKPWISADNSDAKALAEVIDKCPGGALRYILK